VEKRIADILLYLQNGDNGQPVMTSGNLSFHTDEFILKITVQKVTVKVTENGKKGAENKKKALAGST